MNTTVKLTREEAKELVLEGADNVMCADVEVLILANPSYAEDHPEECDEDAPRWVGVMLDDLDEETSEFPSGWKNFELWN